MTDIPLVSISCITFNHAPYLRECFDGFLMQQTDFQFEVVVHDDASTDGTREVIEEYTAKYPNIFFPMYQTENQYSQGVRGMMARFNFPRCRGKYIALCEGDDYWTDPLKLQKQVDFLEENPEYSLVCGGFNSVNTITREQEVIIKDVEKSPDNTNQGFDITIERFFKQWLTKTLTLVYRREFCNAEDFKNYKYTRDVHLNYLLLKRGKGYYMKEVFGHYNVHEGGVFSLSSFKSKRLNAYLIYRELYHKNIYDSYLKKVYSNSIKRLIREKIYDHSKNINKFNLLINLLLTVRSKEELKKFIRIAIE